MTSPATIPAGALMVRKIAPDPLFAVDTLRSVIAVAGFGVAVGVGPELQEGNLKEAMRVLQLNVPLVFRYSFVYQKVQSSTGSMLMLL